MAMKIANFMKMKGALSYRVVALRMAGAGPSAPRVVAVPIAFNEERAIGRVLDRFRELEGVDVAVVDDGSTDRTASIVRERGVEVITRPIRGGAGAAIRTAYAWARARGYDICVILSGNDKDRPAEMHSLIDPIASGEADVVQGSRYLSGGSRHNMPFWRRMASQYVHPTLFSLAARRRMTDTTNGYRALRLSILDDPGFALNQSWLDGYDLEPYVLLRAITLGYGVREVPVSKTYPEAGEPYTKMRFAIDWWRIVRPIVMLGLRLRS
jgi:dolichol-phosphate mannosyltransferase